MTEKLINVRDFGACGNGEIADTEAIQKAIDAVPPGGTVVFQEGTYLIASLRLKSHLTLRFEAGAVFKAITDLTKLHRLVPPHRDNPVLTHYLFGASDAEDITIAGKGEIEGNGTAFWSHDGEPFPDFRDYLLERKPGQRFRLAPQRPVMFFFFNCRNLILRDFSVHDAAAYTIWVVGCEQVHMENLTILNHRFAGNTDALDIDCSSDVTIRNCRIDAGDDCIAVKSDTTSWKIDKICERITVENCNFSSTASAIRIGFEGDGVIRDCRFANLNIHDTRVGIHVQSLTYEPFWIMRGSLIEDLDFDHIRMDNVTLPFWINSTTYAGDDYRGRIKNIRLANMRIDSPANSYIGGATVDRISLENIQYVLRENPIVIRQLGITNIWGYYLPDGITFKNVKTVRLDNVNFSRVICGEAPYGEHFKWIDCRDISVR